MTTLFVPRIAQQHAFENYRGVPVHLVKGGLPQMSVAHLRWTPEKGLMRPGFKTNEVILCAKIHEDERCTVVRLDQDSKVRYAPFEKGNGAVPIVEGKVPQPTNTAVVRLSRHWDNEVWVAKAAYYGEPAPCFPANAESDEEFDDAVKFWRAHAFCQGFVPFSVDEESCIGAEKFFSRRS